MARIEQVLPSPIHHGIIEWYLHRTLLWQRSAGLKTGMIDYGPQGQGVPSWSWMAYQGRIEFQHDDLGKLDRFRDLEFDKEAVRSIVWEFTDPSMSIVTVEKDNTRHQLQSSDGLKRGTVRIDQETTLSPIPHVVVLAKYRCDRTDGSKYLVIFVRQRQSQDGYERLGTGILHRECGLSLKSKGKGRIF
jgi:hypothetical protein